MASKTEAQVSGAKVSGATVSGATTPAPKITIQDGLYMHKLFGQMKDSKNVQVSMPGNLTSLKEKWDNYKKYKKIIQIHNTIIEGVKAHFRSDKGTNEPNVAMTKIAEDLLKFEIIEEPKSYELARSMNNFMEDTEEFNAGEIQTKIDGIIEKEIKYNDAAQAYIMEVTAFKTKYDDALKNIWESFINVNETTIEDTINNIMNGITGDNVDNVDKPYSKDLDKAIENASEAWGKAMQNAKNDVDGLFEETKKKDYKDHYKFLTTLLDKMKDKKTTEFNKLGEINKDIEQWKKQVNYLKKMNDILANLEGADESKDDEKVLKKAEGKVDSAEAKTAEGPAKVESDIKKTVVAAKEIKEKIAATGDKTETSLSINLIDVLPEQNRLDEQIEGVGKMKEDAFNTFLNAIKDDSFKKRILKGKKEVFQVKEKESIRLFQGKVGNDEKELIVKTEGNKDLKITNVLIVGENNNVKWLDIKDSNHNMKEIDEKKDEFKNVETNIKDKKEEKDKILYVNYGVFNTNDEYIKLLVDLEVEKEKAKAKVGGRKSKSRKSKKRRKGRKNKTKKRRKKILKMYLIFL